MSAGKEKGRRREGGGEGRGGKKKPHPKNKTGIQPEICPSLYGKDTHVVNQGMQCVSLAHKRLPRGRSTGAGVPPVWGEGGGLPPRPRPLLPPLQPRPRHDKVPFGCPFQRQVFPPPHPLFIFFSPSSGLLHAEMRGWGLEGDGGWGGKRKKISTLDVIPFSLHPLAFLSPPAPHNSPAPSLPASAFCSCRFKQP